MPNIANISGNLLTDSGIDLSTLPSGSGTLNYLPKWTSSSALGNSLVFDNGTQVLVNTTTTDAVNGLVVRSLTNNDRQGLRVYANNQTAYSQLGWNGLEGTLGEYQIRSAQGIRIVTQTASGHFYIQNSGNYFSYLATGNAIVGGFTDAGFRLDVQGTFRSTGDANINGLTVGRGGGSVASNTAFGFEAINASATGVFNTVLGYTAGRSLTSGYENTFVGYNAGRSNTTGYNNVSVGGGSGFRITTGALNTNVGQGAGDANIVGNGNVNIGYQAGFSGTSDYNINIGTYAGRTITTGQYNIMMGFYTGQSITTGNYNTIIGHNVTGLSSSLSNTIILADGQGNQRLYIDNAGQTGFGTSTPLTASGFRTVSLNNTLGSILDLMRNGSSQMQIQATSTVNAFSGQTSLPISFQTNGSHRMEITGSTGNVIIGGTFGVDAGYKLDVNGTANISGATRIFDANLTMQKGAATGDQRISFRYGGTEYGYVGVNTSSGVAFFGTDTYAVAINTASTISCNGTLRIQSATVSGISPGFQIRNGGNTYFENYVDWGAVSGIIQTPNNYDLRLRTGTNNGILIAKTSGNVTIDANTFLATTAGSVGIGTTSPNASALLDVSSTTKGVLLPRMTGAQAEAIATPADGLVVYVNSGNGVTITSTGFWGRDAGAWVKLS